MIDNYKQLGTGAIKQIKVKPFTYDVDYVKKTYDDNYGIQCDMMSYLRLGFIAGVINRKPSNVLDIGYGNGSFLKICKNANVETFGSDISQYELKHGTFVVFEDCLKLPFDVVTFFDCLEHFENIDFLDKLNCNFLCISVPNCNYNRIKLAKGEEQADTYFEGWKHRKPNEHIWHFDNIALKKTVERYGYELICYDYIEDAIRKGTDGHPNILTSVFRKI